VPALRGADFVLAHGEVHALLGENGAGKSTLLHVASGMIPGDGGTIRVNGREVVLRSPRDARALGIGMVHQHFTSIGALTVGENLALAMGHRGAELTARTAALGQGLDLAARVESLSVGLRQRLEVTLATGVVILLPTPLGLVRQFAPEGGAATRHPQACRSLCRRRSRHSVQGRVTLRPGPSANS
jgi:simple sugar transport system ATP-binding protein